MVRRVGCERLKVWEAFKTKWNVLEAHAGSFQRLGASSKAEHARLDQVTDLFVLVRFRFLAERARSCCTKCLRDHFPSENGAPLNLSKSRLSLLRTCK